VRGAPPPLSRQHAPPPPSTAQDPLAIIGLSAIFLPFVLVLLAGATGLIDFSVYR
jgi:hypothetical protein